MGILDDHGIEVIRKSGNKKDQDNSVYELSTRIKLGDSPSSDAFGRLRTSNPFGVFDHKNIFDRDTNNIHEATVGGGAIAHVPNESSVTLTVGTADGDLALRQSFRYFAYVPGKSMQIMMTGVMGATKANNVQILGCLDDDNGLFFQLDSTGVGVGVRTFTSGAAVDSITYQSNWNLDTLDGSDDNNNPSGVTLDVTKAQIWIIDYQWLGTGRVRFGFSIDGIIIFVHESLHANVIDKVYMSTPSLPVRYENRNTGVAASGTVLKEICFSVTSEGGYTLPGLEFSANQGITGKSITARTPIIAIRLKDSLNSKANRRTIKFLHSDFFVTGQNALFEVAHLHAPTAITGTWSDTNGISAVEMSTDISAITGNPEHVIHSIYIEAGQAGKGGGDATVVDFLSNHSFLSQSFDSDNSQVFVIYATPFTGTATAYAAIDWIEFD